MKIPAVVDARGIIGNYVVERELGRGGMGVVYAAKHRVLGRPAAIKLLLASTSEERGRVERFFNEARAAMAIDHPGVVKIYDVGIAADDRPYIAMELLDGTSLAQHIAPAGLPIRQAVDYACQIAAALSAAHDAGVIHRDLKPENIIISRDRSRAIVVDFGIAKLSHQATVRTATGALVGTPLYMSPEQCEGLRDLDARSDLYAFGCVIFAMLTGRPPFFEGGTGGLIGMHLHVAPPPLRSRCANASEALERVVSVLLAKSPDARFRTARATLAALQAPEVRGLSAAPGVPATADFAPREPLRSVQPWAATPAIAHVARDAQTMGTGIAHANAPAMGTGIAHANAPAMGTGMVPANAPAMGTGIAPANAPAMSTGIAPPGTGESMPSGTAFGVPASREAWTQLTGVDVRDPRTAAVQAVGTPSPSSAAIGTPNPSVAGASSPPSSVVGASSSSSVGALMPSSMSPQGMTPHALPSHAMTSMPSHAIPHHAMTPPTGPTHHAPTQSRRKIIVAIIASSVLTAIVAIGASRGCGGGGGGLDAGVATGSGSAGSGIAGSGSAGGGIPGSGAIGSAIATAGSGSNADAHIDAGVIASSDPRGGDAHGDARGGDVRGGDARGDARGADARGDARGTDPRASDRTVDKAKPTTTPTKGTSPKGATPTGKGTTGGTTSGAGRTGAVQIDPNGPPLPGERPRNFVPGAGTANDPPAETPDKWDPTEQPAPEIHDRMMFQRGDFGATLGQRVLDRIAQQHKLYPNRRIVITGHAEQDEPGVLETLAGARANTVLVHLTSRGVSRGVLVLSSTRHIDPVTANGANRRADIDFE